MSISISEHPYSIAEIGFAVNATSDPIIITNPDGEFEFLNDSAKKIIGNTDQTIYALLGIDKTTLSFSEALNRENIRFELCISAAHSSARTYEFSVSQFEVKATLSSFLWIGRDITPHKEREAIYKLVTESSTDVVSLFDENQVLVYISPVIENMTGFTIAEIRKEGFHNTIHPEDALFVADEISSSVANRKSHSRYKYRQRRKDGSYFWLEVNALRRYDDRGNIIQTIANLRDVDAQVEAEQKLERHDRLLSESNKLAGLGSWKYNVKKHCVTISPDFLELIGIAPSSISSPEDVIKAIVPEHRLVVMKSILNLIKTGKDFNIDFVVENTKKGSISLNSMAYAETDEKGELHMISGVVQDITERKAYESELIDLKNRAEAASLAKTQFLSNMSHEIRTPMNAVYNLSRMLMDENPKPDQIKHLSLLNYSAKSLIHVINDILDISALDEDRLALCPKSIDLQPDLDKIQKLFDLEAEKKGIVFSVEATSLPQNFTVDIQRLTQVLFNLVSNAIKFTEKGKVIMFVKNTSAENNQRIRFEISDTGIGISQEELKNIFKRFYRTKFEDQYKYGGTGLGLSISARLLEIMGAKLNVESQLGIGTTFSFTLSNPMEPTNVIEDNSTNENLNSARDSNDLSSLRILAAEDNSINRFVLQKMLAKWNIVPDLASDGQKAVELFEQKTYDIIFLDLQMPIMDGLEASQKIRSIDSEIPIIAVTAAVLQENRQEAFDAGMNDFVGKPFRAEELLEAIQKHLPKKSSG